MIFKAPPHWRQYSSISNTRLSNWAELMRTSDLAGPVFLP